MSRQRKFAAEPGLDRSGRSNWAKLRISLGLLLAAISLGLIGERYWSARDQGATRAAAAVVIDTQTADVVEHADVAWEQRAYDGLEEPPSTGSGPSAGEGARQDQEVELEAEPELAP
jgi:hypothetical protein